MKRAVVIGAGVGGLSAAILLARDGWQVTVLEQHTRAGGCLHRFFRQGIGYDTGFHYVGSAAPDQTFGRLMRHLGVYDALAWRRLDDDGFDLFRFPELQVAMPVGGDRWFERLAALFPDERDGLAAYAALQHEAVRAYGWYQLDPSVRPEAVLPWEQRSLASVLGEHIGDPRLRAILAGNAPLYGVPPAEAPFGMHAVINDHFQSGAWAIEGGGDRLARALVARLRALGGRLRLKARVAAIEVEDRAVRAVRTVHNDRYECDLVVANVHPRVVLDLLPDGAFRPAYAERVRAARPGLAHLGVYLRVEGDLSPLAGRNLYRYRTWDLDAAAAGVVPGAPPPLVFWTWAGRHDPTGRHRDVVLGLAPCRWELFERWADSDPRARPADYLALKAQLLDDALAALREDLPGCRVTRAEASTPLSTARFLAVPRGATYGHYHSVDQMGRYRLPMHTRVSGLLQVGQAVAFPGVCGATLSAYMALAPLLGERRLIEEVRA